MEINWKYYLSLDNWSEHQAACLLFRIDPTWLIEHEQIQNEVFHLSGATRLNSGLNLERAEAQKLVNMIEHAQLELNQDVVAGIIEPNSIQIKMKADPFDYDFPSFITYSKQNAYFFKPVSFITWANSKKFEVPKELIDFHKNLNLQTETHVIDCTANQTPEKLKKQQQAILEAIKSKNFNPMAIPDGEKGTIQIICEQMQPILFQALTAFDRAWKLGIGRLWKMEFHESYAKRGK